MAVPFSKLLTASAVVTALCSSFATADPYDHHWHGDNHHFHSYDYPHWHEGHWYHGDHGGHFGWWWIAAGGWYFYPAPIYPYPSPYVPPAVMAEPAPAPVVTAPSREQIYYYCKSSRNYYPYVSVCPEGWRAVPAEPSDADDRE